MKQAQDILDILTDVYGVTPWNEQQIQSDLAKEDTEYFFVYAGDIVVGFLAIQDLGDELEMTNIAVKKAYQGQGFAHQLMAQLADRLEPIYLEVRASNQAARSLYERYGFQEVGQRKNYYHNPVEDAIVMARAGRLG